MKAHLHNDIWHSALGYVHVIVLRFSMQGEDIFEHINVKCHVFTHYYTRGIFSLAY